MNAELNRPSARRGSVNAAFIAGLAVMLATGGYISYARGSGKLYLIKKAAPLQKQLDEMSTSQLQPWVLRERVPIPEEVIEELGTKLYIQWILENPLAEGPPFARSASLFVTYYTGVQDQVPHVPDECYGQSGAGQTGVNDIEFKRPDGQKYKVRRLGFAMPRGRGFSFVYYVFIVNGDLYCDRNDVRLRCGWPTEKHLYYSKIEISFRSQDSEAPPEMDRTAERLLNQVISVMLKDHLPDVAAMDRETGAAGAPSK